jgi:hypothetical protein
MTERPDHDHSTDILVINSDSADRKALEQACQAAGLSVRAVSSVAEVERWPLGQIVVTDPAHLTPLWRGVGASEVIVLARNPDDVVTAVRAAEPRPLDRPDKAVL